MRKSPWYGRFSRLTALRVTFSKKRYVCIPYSSSFHPLNGASIVPHWPRGRNKHNLTPKTNLYLTLIVHFLSYKNCFGSILEHGRVFRNLLGVGFNSIKMSRSLSFTFLNNRPNFFIKYEIIIVINLNNYGVFFDAGWRQLVNCGRIFSLVAYEILLIEAGFLMVPGNISLHGRFFHW